MDAQEILNEMGSKITDLINEYNGKIPPYEIGNQLISQAVSMMLYCAPTELAGVKTILKCVEYGVAKYEEDYS